MLQAAIRMANTAGQSCLPAGLAKTLPDVRRILFHPAVFQRCTGGVFQQTRTKLPGRQVKDDHADALRTAVNPDN